MSFYYRSSDPEKLKVLVEYEEKIADLNKRSDKFAAVLGKSVTALIVGGIHGRGFHSVAFENKPEYAKTILDQALWTNPGESGSRRPRAAKTVHGELKELHAEIVNLWDMRPKEVVSRDPVYALSGATWGDFILGGIFGTFIFDGAIYIETSSPDTTESLEEILASVHRSAKEAFTARLKEAANVTS